MKDSLSTAEIIHREICLVSFHICVETNGKCVRAAKALCWGLTKMHNLSPADAWTLSQPLKVLIYLHVYAPHRPEYPVSGDMIARLTSKDTDNDYRHLTKS